jgi:ATP-binding cassette subfamily B protein
VSGSLVAATGRAVAFATATVLRLRSNDQAAVDDVRRAYGDRPVLRHPDAPNTITDPERAVTVEKPPPPGFEEVPLTGSPERFPDLLNGIDLVPNRETMALVGLTGSGVDPTADHALYDDGGRGTLTASTCDLAARNAHAPRWRSRPPRSRHPARQRAFGRSELAAWSCGMPLRGGSADRPVGVTICRGDTPSVRRMAFRRPAAALASPGGRGQAGRAVLDDPLSRRCRHGGVAEAALRQVLAPTTALVVAHRLSTVMPADRGAARERPITPSGGTPNCSQAASTTSSSSPAWRTKNDESRCGKRTRCECHRGRGRRTP